MRPTSHTRGSGSTCAPSVAIGDLLYPDALSHGIGDVAHNYFYRVRAAKATGAPSAGSNTVGEFDFALTPGSNGAGRPAEMCKLARAGVRKRAGRPLYL